MSKNTKNQKSIASFFKTPGQSTTNESTGTTAKASPTIEIKKEIVNEEITKVSSTSPTVKIKKEIVDEEVTKVSSTPPVRSRKYSRIKKQEYRLLHHWSGERY